METYIKVEEKIIDPIRARFTDATWFTYLQQRPILVVGAGGIGSWVSLCLARIGCTVYLYDADRFEVHNMGGQLVRSTDIGVNKVDAVKDIITSLVGPSTKILVSSAMYSEDSPTNPIVISAVDSMAARKLLFDKWAKIYGGKDDSIFIDGRLLAEDYQVYAVTKGRLGAYTETIIDDKLIPTENCSLKSTTHCSLGIASEIVGILSNFAANQVTMKDIGIGVRDIPFKIVKSVPNYLYDITFEPDEKIDKQGTIPVHTEPLQMVLQ